MRWLLRFGGVNPKRARQPSAKAPKLRKIHPRKRIGEGGQECLPLDKQQACLSSKGFDTEIFGGEIPRTFKINMGFAIKKAMGLDHACCEEYGQRGYRREGLLQGKKPLVTQDSVAVF